MKQSIFVSKYLGIYSPVIISKMPISLLYFYKIKLERYSITSVPKRDATVRSMLLVIRSSFATEFQRITYQRSLANMQAQFPSSRRLVRLPFSILHGLVNFGFSIL